MTETSKYLLEMTIKEGTNELPYLCPGLFVQTSVDGSLNIEDNTEIVRMGKNRTVWNHFLSYGFATLEVSAPKIIALSMLRKRSIHQNYKLVGTARFSTSELLPILDKGTIERKLMIYVPHQKHATGTITVSVSLKSGEFSEPERHKSQSFCVPYEIDDTQDTTITQDVASLISTSNDSDKAEKAPQISTVFHFVFIFFIILTFMLYQLMV